MVSGTTSTLSSGDVRAQGASHYSFRSTAQPVNDDAGANQNIAHRLLVLPFTVSLQQHYLVKDPVYQRSDYREINEAITTTVENWSTQQGYVLDVLDAELSSNRFASQRITSTAIRLLNKKGSVDDIPPLQDLVRNQHINEITSIADTDDGKASVNTPTLILAGSYTGHSKSDGQLVKERISARMRYLGSLGRRQLVNPTTGFGRLFVVLLDAKTGEVVWFGDADSSPQVVNFAMDALLSRIPAISSAESE